VDTIKEKVRFEPEITITQQVKRPQTAVIDDFLQ
jgi:hypothetical protein